ncbi:MAG: tripartite tricarboxylate transporter substrate binding protein [Pseudolabrys sp.]|nr:tripartite tricarboxylate transporter substrate binding protein [Pseudolabrys sp.]
MCNTFRTFALAAALALAGQSAALAADPWPTRTITVVVPVGAGSSSDLMTRIVMEQVSKQLGQPIVIENRPGGGGTVGAASVVRAPADGYTLLSYGALAGAAALNPNLPYDTLADLTPVTALGQQPLVMVVSANKDYKTAADLVAAAKAKPGEMNYASAGNGSASHFGGARFLVSTGLQAQHIPYKGAADSMADVAAGRTDFSIQPIAVVLPLVRDGKLKALATMAQARSSALPDVPTAREAGLPADAVYPFYAGLFVSSKTPAEIVTKLHAEVDKALKDPGVKARLANIAADPMPMSMSAFSAFFRDDVASNIATVKAANIRPQ